jgi:ribosomal protein S18 acetylase RimI-like enzyme
VKLPRNSLVVAVTNANSGVKALATLDAGAVKADQFKAKPTYRKGTSAQKRGGRVSHKGATVANERAPGDGADASDAEGDEKVVGFVLTTRTGSSAMICKLCVAEHNRGKGVGWVLLKRALQDLKTRRCMKATLHVDEARTHLLVWFVFLMEGEKGSQVTECACQAHSPAIPVSIAFR